MMEGAISRNKPCPCGSGKKFKLCHGATAPEPTPNPTPSPDERGELAGRLLRALYAERKGALHKAFRTFMEPLTELDYARVAPFFQTESTESAITTYAMYDVESKNGRTFAERFFNQNARTLSERDAAYIRTMLESFVDFYEVRRIDLGRGISLRNLRTGNDVYVHERLATESLVRYEILVARVVEMEPGRPELFPPVFSFDQMVGRDVLANVKRAARETMSGSDVRAVFKTALPYINARWIASQLAPSLRNLHTTEGDPLEPTRIEFRLPDRSCAIAALDASVDFDRDDPNDDRRYSFWGPDKSGTFGGGRVLLASIEVGERSLVGEVMARSRAKRLQAALSAADPAAFEFISEMSEDIEEFGEARRWTKQETPRDDEIDPMQTAEVKEYMATLEEQWRRKWLDEPVPALSGRTPREAARSRTLRPRVIALLKEFEARSERGEREGRPAYDHSWMWKELDLQP